MIHASPLHQTPNQAALVVVHGDGRIVTRCVAFTEAQISGADLLQRSGLDLNIEASSMGATICRIDGEGCTFPQQSCFCQCEGASCSYWSYWRWQDGDWLYSQLGASNNVVRPGNVEGWVWGAGTVDSASKPPPISFASVCAPPTPTDTPSPTPTYTESWTPPTPTSTPTPSAPTATPTATGTATPPPAAVQSFVPTAPNTPTPPVAAAPPATDAPLPPLLPATPTLPAPVIEFFVADRREISLGEVATLSWRTRNADAVQIQAFGRTVTVGTEGNLQVAPPQNTTYQIVASGPGGSTASALTVIVRPAQPVQPAAAPPAPTLVEADEPAVSLDPTATTAVESPVVAIVITASPAAPTTAPTSDATPSLAPVALSPRLATSAAVAPVVSTQPDVQTPLLIFVGLAVLVGIPLLGIAGFLLVWLIQRPK